MFQSSTVYVLLQSGLVFWMVGDMGLADCVEVVSQLIIRNGYLVLKQRKPNAFECFVLRIQVARKRAINVINRESNPFG